MTNQNPFDNTNISGVSGFNAPPAHSNIPPSPTPATKMDKKKKVIIIAVAVSILLIILGIRLYFVTNRIGNEDRQQANFIPAIPVTAWTEEEAISIAGGILNLLSTQRDEFGLYTSLSDCVRENGLVNCVPAFSVEPTATHPIMSAYRESLLVIWANFKYYERTGDTLALARMQDGIDALIEHVIDSDNYILQTNRLNCALMRDIANSPLISQEYRDRANYVCLGGSMIYSNTSFNEGLYLPEEERLAQIPVLESRILQTLNNIDNGYTVTSTTQFSDVDDLTLQLRNQLYALINLDYENYLMGNFFENTDFFYKRSLMFLEDTIEWYFANYQWLAPSEYCLMMAVIDIYGGRIGFNGFHEDTRDRFQHRAMLNDNGSSYNLLVCSFTDYYTNNDNFYKGSIVELWRRKNVAGAYLGNFDNNDRHLNTFINAMIAGLLAI